MVCTDVACRASPINGAKLKFETANFNKIIYIYVNELINDYDDYLFMNGENTVVFIFG